MEIFGGFRRMGGGGLPHIRGLVIYSFCSNHNLPANPTRIKEVSV